MSISFNKEFENPEKTILNYEKESINMSISLEQIDLVVERTKASYTAAREALLNNNGDILDAISQLEREGKCNNSQTRNTGDQINGYVETLSKTYIVISKDDHTYIDAPIFAVLIAMVLCLHISLIALIIGLCCGFRITLKDRLSQKIHFSSEQMASK